MTAQRSAISSNPNREGPMTNSISEAMIEAGDAVLKRRKFSWWESMEQDEGHDLISSIYLAMSRASQPVEPKGPFATHGSGAALNTSGGQTYAMSTPPLDSEAVERVRDYLALSERVGLSDDVIFAYRGTELRQSDLRALLSLAKPVGGEGMVLVPREPTAEMLQGACEKHLPGKPMHDTTPPWPDERYRTDEECPAFVRRRNAWKKMIEAYEATQSDKRGDGR